MSELWVRDEGETSVERVTSANPLPVKTISVPANTSTLMVVAADAQLTVSTTAVLLSSVTGGIPSSAIGVLCAVETAALRLTEDSLHVPTSSVGMPYAAGDKFYIWGREQLTKAKLIRSGAADATLTMQFLAEPTTR